MLGIALAIWGLMAPPDASADPPPSWLVMCRALDTGNQIGAKEGIPFIAGVISSFGLVESKQMVDTHCPSLRAVWAIAASHTYQAV